MDYLIWLIITSIGGVILSVVCLLGLLESKRAKDDYYRWLLRRHAK